MLSAARAEALRATGNAGAVVADLHAFYRRFHLEIYGHDSVPVHDALAVAHLIRPDLLKTEELSVVIDTGPGPGRGQTLVDLLRRTGAPANARVALEVDADGFIDLLCERIAALP
jgi:inosine-uridine nucleoside N-ribohydrolase